MKLIKRALIAFALIRIVDKAVFMAQVRTLNLKVKSEEGKVAVYGQDAILRSALEMFNSDLKGVQVSKAQLAVSRAELKKEMIESYV